MEQGQITYLLVCGSRGWEQPDVIREDITACVESTNRVGGEVRVVHGAARGADQMAGVIATDMGLRVKAMPADWSTGRGAGFARNLAMLALLAEKREQGHLVAVWAYQCNGSRGTQHTIDNARAQGIPVMVVDEGGYSVGYEVGA